MAVARVPIFYTRVGRVIRRGFCVSRYKLVNVAVLSCYDVFYYLQSGKPNFVNARCIFANGPRVWAESGGGTVPPTTCPGALATLLSRRAGPAWRGICRPGTDFRK